MSKHRKSMTRARAGRWLLSGAALLGVVGIALTVAGLLFGVRPLVFQSGSMGPAIPAGSLGLSTTVPAAELRIGDVVSVRSSEGTHITHRIVGIDKTAEGAASLTLRGDANGANDGETYQVAQADRLFFDVPYLGYGAAFFAGKAGLLVLGGAVAALFIYALRPTRRRGNKAKLAALGVPCAAVVLVTGATGTTAAFSDEAKVASGTLAAHTMQAQKDPVCTNVDEGFLVVTKLARLTWKSADARYDYKWNLVKADTGDSVASGTVESAHTVGSTVTLDITSGLLLLADNVSYRVVVQAVLHGDSSWTASSTTSTPVRRAGTLLLGEMRCGAN